MDVFILAYIREITGRSSRLFYGHGLKMKLCMTEQSFNCEISKCSAISASHTLMCIYTYASFTKRRSDIDNEQYALISIYRYHWFSKTFLHRKHWLRNELISHITQESHCIVIFTRLCRNIFQLAGSEFSAACRFSEVDYPRKMYQLLLRR